MKTRIERLISGPLAVGALCLLTACETTSTPSPQAVVKAPELPTVAPTATAMGERPSALSYGMVTGRVQKNVTTQQEIIELFGGPSTMTTDKDGTEVWMYDKTTSSVSGNYAQSGAQAEKSEANTMAAFLGLPFIAGVGEVKTSANSQSAQVSQGQTNVTRSVKTMTFILKWNDNKTVKDFAVRQSSY